MRAFGAALALSVLVVASGCAGSPEPTEEDRALALCLTALHDRLGVDADHAVSQTLMIGRRDYGWLARGLTVAVPDQGEQSFECRVDRPVSGPPVLAQVRLCAPRPSPWGCPRGRGGT